MKISVVNNSKHPLPQHATALSAGVDLRANIDSPVILKPGERVAIPTGLHIQLPQGYEAQIRPRSGLAIKHGIAVLNSPGTIDADYTGEICVIVINHSAEVFKILDGERMCQMVIAKYKQVQWVEVDSLNETERGSGSLGSTGRQ